MTETEQYNDAIGVTTLEADAKDQFPEKSPWKIHGIALPENTVVNGGQGVDHFYPPKMAKRAAEIMQEQIDDKNDKVHLVSGFHELEGQADPEQIVGEITAAGYEKGTGVVFEGETISEDVANRIAHDYVEVSPTIARSLGEFSEEKGAQAVDRVTGFRDVAIVGNGQTGVDVSVGGNPAVEALARDALSRAFDPLQEELDLTPPQTAQENAQKVLRWREEHPDEIDGMTSVGWNRAEQLASGDELTRDVVKKMAQFNRHRSNAPVAEEHKGKPWMDAGHVAWLGWGGDTGINWAIRMSDKMDTMGDTDTLQDDFKTVAGVRFQGTREGKLDESEIDKEETDLSNHALYGSGENKSDYSYWVVDADGYLRKGNVESAHSLGCRGQCPGEEQHDETLMELAGEFENPPEFAQEESDTNSQDSDEAMAVVDVVEVEESNTDRTIELVER